MSKRTPVAEMPPAASITEMNGTEREREREREREMRMKEKVCNLHL
jgi:hypothetical protein